MKLSPTVPRLLPCFAIFWAVSGCFAAVFAQAPENSLFTDIPADSAFFLPVSFLKSNDLISGYSDGSFHPERTVTRAEALAIILKMSEKDAAKESGDLEKNIAPEGELIIQLPTKSSAASAHFRGQKPCAREVHEKEAEKVFSGRDGERLVL
ncbi:S-layer homology domain-containing protein [Candidatus Peregrinibacteria bacterium]|nr:S-layer homology domain-containing protein [Candidatus Peregrinibacteria bacterium]